MENTITMKEIMETNTTTENDEEMKGCLNMNTTTNKTTKEEIIEKIIEWFDENEDAFETCIEELDGWNGYLNGDRYYMMDELEDIFCSSEPLEILQRAFYGYDENKYINRDENRQPFNPNRDYFKFNGYGNLVSSDYKDYSAFLDRYTIEEIIENRDNVYAVDDYPELEALFDEYEAINADEEE